VVIAASGYFHATGLVYAFTAISMMLFSAYQGRGRTTVPLLTGLLRVTAVLVGGWVVLQWPGAKLDWPYYVVAVSIVLAATTLAVIFALRPPGAVRKAVSG
jgi:Na+-driven multidrug efflux pump